MNELNCMPSQDQAEYFKDSVIRDPEGNLLVCKHGTKGELYNVVDFDKLGTQGGSGYGPFFYASDSVSEAGKYCHDDQSHMIAVFMDIKNPLDAHACGTISDEQFAEILKKADPEEKLGQSMKNEIRYKEKDRLYPDKGPSAPRGIIPMDYQPPKKVLLDYISFSDSRKDEARAIYDIFYAQKNLPQDVEKLKLLYDALKEVKPDLSAVDWNRAIMKVTGYDGFVKGEFTQVGAFFPEQIKAVNNYHPKRDNQIFGDAPIKSVEELATEQAERSATRQRERENEPEREVAQERKPARSYDECER